MDVPQGTGWAKGAWDLNLENSAHRGKYGSLLQSAWFPVGCLNQGDPGSTELLPYRRA